MELKARPVSRRTIQDDTERTGIFAAEMLKKWQKGRATYGTEFKIDPLAEAMEECVDIANYALEMYFRIGALKEELNGSKDSN